MIQNIKTSKFIRVMNLLAGFAFIMGTLFITSCEEELPGIGSQPDSTPPVAGFAYSSDSENQLKMIFTNTSESATDFVWDFGSFSAPDSVLNVENPIVTFPEFAEYEVTLMSTDKLGAFDTTKLIVSVKEGPYQPIILEPGFEGDGETGDGRDPWREKTWTESGNSWADGNSVFGITGSPVTYGDAGAKLEVSSARQGYQEITVEADQNYDLFFYYTMKDDSSDPWAKVQIVGVTNAGGAIASAVEARENVIASVTVNDVSDPEVYVKGKITFDSEENTTIGIYFWNDANVETRFDEFSIEIAAEGAVPPSSSFSTTQSTENYLEYSFENGSEGADSYEWDFGDGSEIVEKDNAETFTYEYAQAGTYTITLTSKSISGLSGTFTSTIVIHDPVTAGFVYSEGTSSSIFNFEDQSVNAVSVLWEFGDGYQYSTTETNATVQHIFGGGPGYYTVSLTATSSTGLESVKMESLAIGIPKVNGGDFENLDEGDVKDFWRPNSWSGGGSTTPFGGSSDGAFQTYDGTDTDEKTRGAKIDGSKCAQADGSKTDDDTRYSYQEMTLDAGDYYLEFSYNNADGDVVAGEILDGHFDDGTNAHAASLDGSSLVEIQGTQANGETSGGSDSPQWRTIRAKFTAPASGEIAIWMWAAGGKSYYDNVKILPAFLVED
ncbi:MAG: PKD domain-containing protein [Reichenbachiella sp.]